MDEGHHTPASTFTGIIDSSHATYKIGLSGTMTRRDGKHVFFRDFFGSKVYKPAQSNTMDPTIHLYPTNMSLPIGKNWADKMNKLLYDPEYQRLIAYIAAKHVSMGHKVLVIGDRTEFLEEVHKILGDSSILVIGVTKDREEVIKEVSEGNKKVICGSRGIFAEGMSVNSLSCVILAAPIANAGLLEQVIGRVMRLSPGKLDPVVIDMQFKGYSEKKQTMTRLSFYFEKGWKVVGL
jgi:superfamily II DNA or RNA helicase